MAFISQTFISLSWVKKAVSHQKRSFNLFCWFRKYNSSRDANKIRQLCKGIMDLFYVRIATHTGQIELILTWMTWSNRVNREKQNCFTKQCYQPSSYRHQGVVSGWWARSHKCCIQIMCFLPQQRILPWGAPIGLCVVVMMRFNLWAYELIILKKKQIPNFLIHFCRVSKFFQFPNVIFT